MRHYEIVLLIHPSYSKQADEMGKRCQAIVTEGKGVVHRYEDIRRLQLAYPIQNVRKAYFLLLNVECDEKTHQNLASMLKLNDAVIRHLILRVDHAITDPSALMKWKQSEASVKSDENEATPQKEGPNTSANKLINKEVK